MKKNILRFISAALVFATLVLCAVSCTVSEGDKKESESEKQTEKAAQTETETETEKQTETETETESESETESETEAETEAEPTEFYSPLTGLPISKELYYQRPVAIMLNNLPKSLPQVGISQGEVFYECTVEGTLTRIMMLTSDYANLTEVGSVRSSREYFIDFASNHNAIYIHAGGSSSAYDSIQARNTNNIDYVNGYLPSSMYYRSEERKQTMGLEHSLMTDGARIVSAIAYKGYSTTVSEDYSPSFLFVDYGTVDTLEEGDKAENIRIPYNAIHHPRYVYDAETGLYSRYQYSDDPHIDGATGEILTFTNILILCMKYESLNDDYNHINVYTTGEGEGYYISQGKAVKIKWTKASEDEPMVLYRTDGTLLRMNCGKTFVNAVNSTMLKNMSFNADM